MWAVWMGAVLLGMGKRRDDPLARAVKPFVGSVMVNRPTGSWKAPRVQCIKMSLFLGLVLNEETSVCVLGVANSPAASRQTSLFGRGIVGKSLGSQQYQPPKAIPVREQSFWESPHAHTHVAQ